MKFNQMKTINLKKNISSTKNYQLLACRENENFSNKLPYEDKFFESDFELMKQNLNNVRKTIFL